MTRDEILQHYKVDHGIIRSPGKFEGEPVWAVAFWDATLLGCSDDELSGDAVGASEETLVSVFTVSDTDRAEWPELATVKTIRMWESDQGFVNTETDEL
jgi:hypothetical protein